MYLKDEDDVNTVAAENRAYQVWEQQEKNRILAMSKVEKKQAAWQSLFPKWVSDDSYLAGNTF